jgi:hypothetical protein
MKEEPGLLEQFTDTGSILFTISRFNLVNTRFETETRGLGERDSEKEEDKRVDHRGTGRGLASPLNSLFSWLAT